MDSRKNVESVPTQRIEHSTGAVDLLGNYRLLQPLGEGGMGTVWIAEQLSPVRRRVALKLIKPGIGGKEIVARFEAERQALALMNHPNIARILDAGTTVDGQPFFAMELVLGKTLSSYCDDHKLGIEERLRLFIDICSGVQHAHQKGIVHRDLKPSNILVAMVDDKPVPKVIDFGLAKALESSCRLTDNSLFTGIGQVLGTLRYMSPEQATLNPSDLDTRADIYALGVILYELLTGRTPLEEDSLKGVLLVKALEAIQQREPLKPSTRLNTSSAEQLSAITAQRQTDASRLSRVLEGDLDWIVMKALEKDRARRYDSASGFAADIHRYLDNEPVIARPPTMGYRLTKFFCKNRTAVITASCVALSLVGGIIGTSLAMLRAQQAESLANSRLVELRQAYERESEQRTRSQREQIRLLIESLLRAKGDDFSVVLNALQSCDKSMVLAELNPRFEAAQVPEIKVPLAFALATFGVVQLDYLISSIDEQSESDHAKLIVALQASPERALASIHSAARQCTTSGTWRRKSKLAMVSLAIGDLQLFAEVAEYRQIPNHDLRSTLIDEFPRWPLDLKRLCDSVRQCDSPPLRSAVCLGIGSLPLDGLGERDRNAVVGLANGWYQTLDSATHSAAAWLLRRLNCQPPDVDSSTRIVDGRDWYKNSQGATMILVRPESVSTIQLPDPRDRHYKIISETKENQTNGILKNADLLRRGAAYYHTEQFELAARDLELYISAIRKKEVNDTYSPESQFQYAYQMHTITLAKLNRRFEADKAYEQMRNFLATNISYAETEASTVIREKLKSDREESNRQLLEYMDIVMALFFGDTDIARQRLADTVEAASKSSDQTYILRAAFAICQYINHLHLQGSERQDYVDKALYLLERWESVTYVSPRNILLDAPAWMALYELDRFKSIVLSVPKVPYWIAACEVSRREFEDFLQDSNYAGEKPNAEDVAHAVHASLKERFSPTPQHPVTTRLEGAILFCNWLSSREGLQKVYRVGGKQSVYNFQLGKKVDVNDWEADSSADGYQLPPLINWEHACRAGCMDDYSTGGQEQFLKLVAQIDSEASGACGEKMPNELGIHDMHGNFEELCSKGSKQYLLKGGNFMFSPARATWGDRVRYFNRQELTLEPVGIRLFRNISPAKR